MRSLLQKQQAEKIKQTNDRSQRRKAEVERRGAFRVPHQLDWDREILRATHAGEVHRLARKRLPPGDH